MVNDEIREIAARIQKALNPLKIYLFGSFARGDYTEDSEYDIYVVVPDGAGRVIELEQNAYKSLIGMRRRPVDILVNHESSFKKRSLAPTLEREVLREGVLVDAI